MTGGTPSTRHGACALSHLFQQPGVAEGRVSNKKGLWERRLWKTNTGQERHLIWNCVPTQDATPYPSRGHLSHRRTQRRRQTRKEKGPHMSHDHTGKQTLGPDRTPDWHSQSWRCGPRHPDPASSQLQPAWLTSVPPACAVPTGWLPYLGLHSVTVLRVAHLDVLAVYALEDVQDVPDKGCLGHFPST